MSIIEVVFKDVSQSEGHQPVFYAGQSVEGVVIVTLDKPKWCKGLTVKFRGSIAVTTKGAVYVETYLYHNVEILPNQCLELSSGVHSFEFVYNFPHRLPQSSKQIGKKCIKYLCKGTLKAEMSSDIRHRQIVILRRKDYCDTVPMLCRPLSREFEKKFRNIFYKRQKLTLTVSVPCTGFAIGETIPVKIVYENKSRHTIKATSVELVEKMIGQQRKRNSYFYTSKTSTLAKENNVGVAANESKQFTHALKIPQTVYISDFLYSNLYTLRHGVVVTAYSKGLHRTCKVFIPIVIGSERLGSNKDEDLQPLVDDDILLIEKHLVSTSFEKVQHFKSCYKPSAVEAEHNYSLCEWSSKAN